MQFTVTMPKLSPTMEEGVIAKWHKKEGDLVKSGELLLEITTDKATLEHNALDEGYLRKILVKEGETAQLNQPIALFTEQKDESIKETEAPKKEVAPSPTAEKKEKVFTKQERVETDYEHIKASPLAKKLARERGIDLSQVVGSGPGGRITSEDLDHIPAASLHAIGGEYDEIVLSPMRKIIGKRLQESKSRIPHYYVRTTVDATSLVEFREKLKNLGTEVTFNDLIIKAVALALRQHPEINTGFNPEKQTILRFKNIDISIAVTLEGGLITPIVTNADKKSLKEIKEEEYKGGSFTISNLGMYGITEFTAVINPPQAAILAVGGILDAALIKDGKVVPGKSLNLTLSLDHRVIDGADAAKFLKTLKSVLETSLLLLLDN